ncbi:Protein FAM193A [Pseudolycoriella hygida]|uniref:Protein FAM193A n=1 Tax=Pseudolycoriella hygida TaxID=35572 RepID=A0A9Q0S070_9DIPT|nr:Protein FAM193A [Pseudolycoriella hygida]
MIMRRFYDLVPGSPVSANDQWLSDDLMKWISDGKLMDTKKNIQLSLGNNLPLSNDMTFVLVFSILFRRDPHQLYELLCFQLRSIAITYSEGFKDILKLKSDDESETPSYNPVELLNFILDGYERVCSASKALAPLLFELQRGHLQKFSLTWNILNKRMYQRWVYWNVKELIPECILKLKTILDSEKYKAMVYRFIKFDDEMTLLTFKWREIWSLTNDYHMDNADAERRRRMYSVHSILKRIKNTKFKVDFKQFEDDKNNFTPVKWLTMEDKSTVWKYAIYFLKTKWVECSEHRLYAENMKVQCLKCDFALATHYVDCPCRTCILAGGPCFTHIKENATQFYCTKCTVFEKLDRDYLDSVTEFIHSKSEEANKKVRLVYQPKDTNNPVTFTLESLIDPSEQWNKDHGYHLSWAVFKHLPTRRPYNTTSYSVQHFCSFQSPPCNRNECRVATQIIAGLYPLNFSKFLLTAYTPLNEEERKELMNIQHLYFTYLIRKLCNENARAVNQVCVKDVMYDVDDADYALLCDIGSAFAECYLTDAKIPLDEALESCFLCDGFDIDLNMVWLDRIYETNVTENSHCSPSKRKNGYENDPKLLELKELRTHMDKLFLDRASLRKSTSIKQSDLDPPLASAQASERFSATLTGKLLASKKEKKEQKLLDQVTKAANEDHKLKSESSPPPNDHLTEAIKLAVNQELSMKLEEELRTLKEEHSALKDMVRDLEQIKENEEKHVRITTEKNGHFCCNEHMELPDSHPNKMCHTSDGRCTCYYCTIFGHTECNHGRMNETRDRLRKKLHQHKDVMNQAKSPNIKNVKGLFKKTINSNHSVVQKNTKHKADLSEAKNLATALSAMKSSIPQSSNVNSCRTVESNDKKQATSNVNPAEVVTNVKMEPTTHPKEKEKPRMEKIPHKTNERVLIQPGSRDKPLPNIQDILEYIEGSCNKKDSIKKAAKKAKQKQKKLDVKRVEELEQMREDFHEVFFKEAEAKIELKLLKAAKKKDKKKITEIENSVKKLGKLRAKIETPILELIAELKKNNIEFKFAYLPSKEQQQEKLHRDIKPPSPPTVSQPQAKLAINDFPHHGHIINPEHFNNTSCNMSLQNGQKQNCEVSLDPSKRMVTIRRVNVPHSDAQVTVTAKGLSPDKDKLLYTFINGQLINAPNQQAPINTTPISQIQQYHLQHQQLRQQNLNAAMNNAATAPSTANNATNKVEKKKAKKELNKQSSSESFTNKSGAKDEAPSKCNGTNSLSSSAITATQKRKDKKLRSQIAKQSSVEDSSSVESVNRNVKAKAKDAIPISCNKSQRNSVELEPATKLTKDLETDAKKEERRKVKAPKYEYADPQYKTNKFDVLDLDDDDDYYISEEESVDSGVATLTGDTQSLRSLPKKTATKAAVSNKNTKQSIPTPPSAPKTEKSKPTKELTSQLKKEKSPVEVEVQLTKKQRKKLAQQQARLQKQESAKASAAKNDSLTNAMHKLRLNEDTTIELVEDNHVTGCNSVNSNVSIMDQLNRGIKVEGLMLPPGITLTRVNPATVEANRARMESIARISQPMQPVPPEQTSHIYMPNAMGVSHPMVVPLNMAGQDPNGFVMIDPMNTSTQLSKQQLLANAANAKLKRKKRKGKNKKSDESDVSSQHPKVVTLRNPLFHANNEILRQPMPAMAAQLPVQIDQPAAIIKNETTGMFTIRNPALHQALSNGVLNSSLSGMRTIGPDQRYIVPDPSQQDDTFFNQNSGQTKNGITPKHTNQSSQAFQAYDNQSNYGFNEFFGASPVTVPATAQAQGNFFNGNGFGGYSNGVASDCGYMFGNPKHRCDDSPPLSSTNNYYEGLTQSYSNKYDDMTFLYNLQPGQRLNNEVTIHNISESKFHRDQPAPSMSNGVEITRIPGPTSHHSQTHIHPSNLAVGSQRPVRNGEQISEFGDSVFAPNQTVNLSELESEERDIESFKRFDYYFEPPKNKPKVNFNVKEIKVRNKMTSSDSSSPYFGESSSPLNVSELDDLYHDLNVLSLSHNCDPRQQINSSDGSYATEHYLHGLADELANGMVD